MKGERIAPFNRWEVLSSDTEFWFNTTNNQIGTRSTDHILQPGILVLPTATAVDLEVDSTTVPPGGQATQFVITASATAGNFHVGPASSPTIPIPSNSDIHIAYNANGERIRLPAGDDVAFNKDAPVFTTGNVQGTTPFSTGRVDVDGRPPVAGGPFDRFVFIAYLPVVRPLSLLPTGSGLPPDHENTNGPLSGGNTTQRKPVVGIDQKEGKAFAHQIIDGYRIYTALSTGESSEVTFGSDGTPILASPDTSYLDPSDIFVEPTKALYIGRFQINSLGAITSIILSDAIRPRKPLRLVSMESAKVESDATLRTQTYVFDQTVNLQQHVAALGTAAGGPTPRNAHGMSIGDIEGGTLEPKNTQYQVDDHDDGIVDKDLDVNNPVNTTAVQAAIINSPFVLSGDVITGTLVPSGPTKVKGTNTISSGTAVVSIVQFDTPLTVTQSMYMEGIRFDSLAPQRPGSPSSAIIPFSTQTAGDYTIFAMNPQTLINFTSLGIGTSTALIGVIDTPNFVQINGVIPICQVRWTGTQLQKSKFTTTTVVYDQRNVGLTGKPQISTKGMGDADEGMLSAQLFTNNIVNSSFSVTAGDGTGVGLPPNGWDIPVAGNGTLTLLGYVSGGDLTDMKFDTPGPKSSTGIKLTMSDSASTLNKTMRAFLSQLKPNTTYTISTWFRLDSSASDNVNVTAKLVSFDGSTDYSLAEELLIDRNSLTKLEWQRVSATISTNSSPDPGLNHNVTASTSPSLEYRFAGTGTITSNTIQMTNVVVVEGEWSTGHIGPRAYSGEIFMWDKTTSCPPGSVVVSAMSGMIPVGSNTGALTVGASGGTPRTSFTFGGGVTNVAGAHAHTATGGGIQGGGFDTCITSPGWRAYWKCDFPSSTNGAHSHTVSFTTLGQYSLLFCRRM